MNVLPVVFVTVAVSPIIVAVGVPACEPSVVKVTVMTSPTFATVDVELFEAIATDVSVGAVLSTTT